MKNFQQNLLILLALALCGLCIYQWTGETTQRTRIEKLNQGLYEKSAALENLTNAITASDRQIAQMDTRITELKLTAKTNDQIMIAQKHEIARIQANGEILTNTIVEYKKAVDTLQNRLREDFTGTKKQNDAMKELAAQRDDFIQKYNQSVKDRNDLVTKYNDLVQQIEKLQKPGP